MAPLLSDEHFSIDGTLIKAWASMKSFQPKAGAEGSEPPGAGSSGSGEASAEAQACEAAATVDKGRNAEVDSTGRNAPTRPTLPSPIPTSPRSGTSAAAPLADFLTAAYSQPPSEAFGANPC